MNKSGSAPILPSFFLLVLLVLLITPAALAQEDDSADQPQSWQEKWTSTDFIQQQFQANPFLFFLAIFALGVAVSFTPCVLPMIPITVSIISGTKQKVPGRTFSRSALTGLLNSLVYVLGLSTTYALLGLAAASLGVVVRVILQGCAVLAVIGVIYIVLGLSMVGLFNLPLPGWGKGSLDSVVQKHKARSSLFTAFLFGLISGVIASPCVAPVIGALLIWISTGGPLLGFSVLFIFGWGMGLLLVVMGMTGWIISSGKWMLVVKAALGVLLALFGAYSLVQGFRCKPLTPGPAEKPSVIVWLDSEPGGLALAEKANKPVLIDFYADWCTYCHLMDNTTFQDAEVLNELSRFVCVKVDLTTTTEEGLAAARKYQVLDLPTFVFIDTKGRRGLIPGYIPPDRFLRILKIID